MDVGVSEVTVEGFLRSGRDEKIAAVAAAPVAAEMPAMMAKVVLDIVSVRRLEILEKQRISTTYKVTTTKHDHEHTIHAVIRPSTMRYRARDSR